MNAQRKSVVLVVDDSESVRNVLRLTLHHQGYTVLTSADGLGAIAQYEGQPAVDLVLQ